MQKEDTQYNFINTQFGMPGTISGKNFRRELYLWDGGQREHLCWKHQLGHHQRPYVVVKTLGLCGNSSTGSRSGLGRIPKNEGHLEQEELGKEYENE